MANLMANRRLARAIGDAAWSELARQFGYKAAWFGAELVVCDRWFASTKTCSRCGTVKQHLGLAERIFCCDGCGLALDQDRNAALNLAAWEQAEVAEELEQRGVAGEVRAALGAEEHDRQQPDQAAQDHPVEQPGDGAHVLFVGEQTHPGLEVAPLDDGGDAVQLARGRRSSRARLPSSRRPRSSSEAGARLALAHSAAICSAAAMTR